MQQITIDGGHAKHTPLHARTDHHQDIAQVDDIIERLLEVRNGRPGKQVQLAENEIRLLCLTAKEIFMSQPNLLELEAPIKICGGCRGRLGRSRSFLRWLGASPRSAPFPPLRRYTRAVLGPAAAF
jgi:hypothetical protein